MVHTYTVVLRDDGVLRHYPCENRDDAHVLFKALCVSYGRHCVEMWKIDHEIAA